MLDTKSRDEHAPAARRSKSAALAVETDLDGLEGLKLLSPAKSPSGIAFELTDHFKTPRADVQSKARARLEGYLSSPAKEGRPGSPAGDPLPRLLSRGRAARLHIENEAKKQTAERAGTKQAERLRRLSSGLSEKASHALEKRREVLAENIQKAKKHNEAVEGKVKKFQEAEEHRREELKAKLERKTGSKVSGKVSDGLASLGGRPAEKFEPPARASGDSAAPPRRPSEPESGGWQRLARAMLSATEVA
jgi:hypothetical protein